jgi:4-hydroxythreonine-4-phosphate dehydrogenase
MSEMIPRIAIVPGEPAGIGPDIVLALADHPFIAELVIIADPALLTARAQQLGLSHAFLPWLPHYPATAGTVSYCPISLAEPVMAGQLNAANVPYVLESLRVAAHGCLNKQFDAVVTGPVQKSIINQAGIPFTGQTEFLAALTHSDDVVMMLADTQMRVALVTTHLPLKDVPAAITADKLRRTLHVLHHELRTRFGITKPRILVCGLNPHAGEGGYLGREEIEIIHPVLEQLREEGMMLIGTVPADTAFTEHMRQQADAIVCMYHDQGLPVIKSHGFGDIVNVTLGMPIIRTSVDHGTALELAGTGKANPDSLLAAIKLAMSLLPSK